MPKEETDSIVEQIYVKPSALAIRWNSSRTTVDRVARKNQFRKFMLGEGMVGSVRYLWEDVLAFEQGRSVALSP